MKKLPRCLAIEQKQITRSQAHDDVTESIFEAAHVVQVYILWTINFILFYLFLHFAHKTVVDASYKCFST